MTLLAAAIAKELLLHMRPHVVGLSHDTSSQRAVHEVFIHREIR